MKIKTTFRTLKKIYHISDIQIRNLKRHTEYEGVFNKLLLFEKFKQDKHYLYFVNPALRKPGRARFEAKYGK